MSGGLILSPDSVEKWKADPDSVAPSDWKGIGPGPINLMAGDSTPFDYLGLLDRARKPPGEMTED